MAKTKTKPKPAKAELPNTPEPLAALKAQLASDQFGYDQVQDLPPTGDESYAMVWGRHQGRQTPRILLVAVPTDAWPTAEHVQELGWAKPPSDTPQDDYPKFAAVTDGSLDRVKYFDISTSPPQEIDLPSLPRREESVELQQFHADPTYRWSMRMYDRLQKGFNAFHEQVYQTVKDRVNGKNDIILEVAKFLFLESFRLHHHGAKLEFRIGNEKRRLDQVFTAAYLKEHGKHAVTEIQAAFDHFKLHEDYVVTDDAGTKHPIFDAQTHLLLSQPRNYETLLELIQDLPPVTLNDDKTVLKKNASLRDVAGDVLGRAFDVFLRANFDSKGGIGIYLTPAPVKQCMLALAFHDILKETPELLTARNDDGTPTFRFGDPACGTYGFGVVAMGYLRRTLVELLGRATGSDAARDKLFEQMCAHSFVGADAADKMVTLARVNMALIGAPKAKIFYTQDSLVTEQLQPSSYDLICTNPPFGTAKFGKDEAEARERYEKDREKILEKFRTDLKPREGRGGGLVYEPTVNGLAMGASPDKKGIWKPVGANSVDPAVLFLDRCLQLLKPGGRLLIVLPDGVLCNSGDKYVREYILGKKDEQTGTFHGGKAIVKAVISLPADCFKLSGTGAKTSILYLQKRRARKGDPTHFEDQPQTDVFMAVADTLGYEVKNNTEDYSKGLPNDLATIEGAYRRGE